MAPNQDLRLEDDDWQLIYSITNELKSAPKRDHSVATQGARLLEDLSQARYGCEGDCDEKYEAVVPYFGKIWMMPGKGFTRRTSSTPGSSLNGQLQTPPDLTASNSAATKVNPLVTFDGFSQPLGEAQFGQENGANWSSMVNLDLRDDWSWFLNGPEAL